MSGQIRRIMQNLTTYTYLVNSKFKDVTDFVYPSPLKKQSKQICIFIEVNVAGDLRPIVCFCGGGVKVHQPNTGYKVPKRHVKV